MMAVTLRGDTKLSPGPAGPGISPCKDKEQITMEMRQLEWVPIKRLCLISGLLTRCCSPYFAVNFAQWGVTKRRAGLVLKSPGV